MPWGCSLSSWHGGNGEGHSCDPVLCFYWLEHPASIMMGADWGEELGRVEKQLGAMRNLPVLPPSPDLGRTGCCSSARFSQDPQIGNSAASSCPLLHTSGSLALQTLASQDGFTMLLPAELRFADKGSPKNRKSLGVWPISTPHTSVSQFPQRVGRRKHWRVDLLSSISPCQQHLLFLAKVSAALSSLWIPCCCWLPKCHNGQKNTFSFCQWSDNFCLILLGTAPAFDLSG